MSDKIEHTIDRIVHETQQLGVECVLHRYDDGLIDSVDIIQPPHWQYLYYRNHRQTKLYYVPMPQLTYRYAPWETGTMYLKRVFFTGLENFDPWPLPNYGCYGVNLYIKDTTSVAYVVQAFWESVFNDDIATWYDHPFWSEVRKRSLHHLLEYFGRGDECFTRWETLSLQEAEEIVQHLIKQKKENILLRMNLDPDAGQVKLFRDAYNARGGEWTMDAVRAAMEEYGIQPQDG